MSIFLFVAIHVVSSEADDYDRIIVPREDAGNIPTVTAGYYPEGNGEHYVSIERIDQGRRHRGDHFFVVYR